MNAEINLSAGVDACKKEKYQRAIKFITIAIDSGQLPPDALAYAYKWRAAATWNDKKHSKITTTKALEDIDKAIILSPVEATLYYMRAVTLYDSIRYFDDMHGALKKAVDDLNKVLELDPTREDALQLRKECYRSQDIWDKGIKSGEIIGKVITLPFRLLDSSDDNDRNAENMKTTKDKTWRKHMQTGSILEDIPLGEYRMVLLEVTKQSSFMHYHYRLIIFPASNNEPVLSLNLESNPIAGTCCLGAHLPEGHDNLGFVDDKMPVSAFRKWAFDAARQYLGITQQPPPNPEEVIRTSDDDEEPLEDMHTYDDSPINHLASELLEPPMPGAVTDYERAKYFEAITPHISDALTHVVPALAKYAKHEGKRSLFGRDKGDAAKWKLEEKLYFAVIALYGDGLLAPGASTDECLLALIRSLLTFKEIYLNWTDAYTAAYELFVEKRDYINEILSGHQSKAESLIIKRP